ncbi:MAG TPA: alpha-amylase family glycosyl hydrolase [Casimicrobiaceae bacterium]|nr:alpha-amylase family glycosyl hydrolase [Casimicrobiaceae bacterium]
MAGMIEIYGAWIDNYGVDGFRIDTAQHVNPEFWQKFVPAMLERAKARGIPNFSIFGEVATSEMDPAHTAVNTRVDKLPNILDFSFGRAVIDTAGGQAGTDELAKLFRADPLYEGGADAARRNPTFLGNHDAGRFPALLKIFGFKGDDAELLKRDTLGHAMMLTLRGVPTIYSGDEQGFVGKGGDQDARQDMFASKVATYNEDKLLGSNSTNAKANFDENHPIYREIAKLASIRTSHPALTRGRQVVRYSQDKPGLFAASRFDPNTGREILLLFNTLNSPVEQNVVVETNSVNFETLAGTCAATASAPGSVHVSLPALGYAVCNAR